MRTEPTLDWLNRTNGIKYYGLGNLIIVSPVKLVSILSSSLQILFRFRYNKINK